jgi:hypothetical protein
MESGTEAVEDGQDVLNHFSFWTETCLIENHEFAPVLLTEPLKQVKSKSGQSVFVRNDNHADIS